MEGTSEAKAPAIQLKTITGIIKVTGKGMGYLTLEDEGQEIVVEPEFINTALTGDEVEIQVTGKYFEVKRGRSARRTTVEEGAFEKFAGQVTKIIKRRKTDFVGTLVQEEGKWWVRPDDRRMYADISIPLPTLEKMTDDRIKNALNVKDDIKGETDLKVLARIMDWDVKAVYPTGEIVEVVGLKGTNETEIQSIVLDRGIVAGFPAEVLKEAQELEKTEKPLNPGEIARRRDFRDTLTFTIDPADAKDFDDAISFKDLGGDKYEIGVHIADVSYYVREGTNLNREAARRSTSIYLVDRVIPMLPEVLSNDLCSLNPNEDKFVFSAVFTMNAEGQVIERWFGRSVINSDKRFTYETAQESIDSKGVKEYSKELMTLNAVAKKLVAQNYKNGAINFDQDEVKFKLDGSGKPIDVYRKPHLETHKLVEEYMLLANREVALYISKAHKNQPGTSIYRIHDLPDKDRISELSLFIKALGYNLPVHQGKVTSRDINALLKSVEGVPEESLIKTATIRSMAKAVYSTRNIGHFGLGFEYYTHFTSPIRRYADLVVHRTLDAVLNHNEKMIKEELGQLDKISNHATDQEIIAADAERASIKLKQVEYMADHLGEEFDGVISGVADWGIYIEESRTKCEGLTPMREIGDDFYTLNKKTYTIIGERTQKKFRLGDKVRFKVVKADLENKTLDYKIL